MLQMRKKRSSMTNKPKERTKKFHRKSWNNNRRKKSRLLHFTLFCYSTHTHTQNTEKLLCYLFFYCCNKIEIVSRKREIERDYYLLSSFHQHWVLHMKWILCILYSIEIKSFRCHAQNTSVAYGTTFIWLCLF